MTKLEEASFFADMVCDEINVHNFSIDFGKDENDKQIKLNYNRDNAEWYWLHGTERKEVKDKQNIAKIFFNTLDSIKF